MPLYQYQCDACGHCLEEFQRMGDAPLRTCPECRKRALVRAIGTPALHGTDTGFSCGLKTLRDQFKGNDRELMRVVEAARAQGYEPKATDYYDPYLAGSTGDPDGFIPHIDPRGHVKRVCKKRRVGCQGSVEIPTPPPPDPAERVTKRKGANHGH